jgi:hypothetical protein
MPFGRIKGDLLALFSGAQGLLAMIEASADVNHVYVSDIYISGPKNVHSKQVVELPQGKRIASRRVWKSSSHVRRYVQSVFWKACINFAAGKQTELRNFSFR